MNTEQARDTILGIFKAAWDPTGYPVFWTDVPGEKPASETVWARVTIRHATGRQSSLSGAAGTKRFESTGTLFVQVFAPIGDGSAAGYSAALLARDAYRDAQDPDVWFRNVRMNEAGASGAFEQFNVLADFSYDEVR